MHFPRQKIIPPGSAREPATPGPFFLIGGLRVPYVIDAADGESHHYPPLNRRHTLLARIDAASRAEISGRALMY